MENKVPEKVNTNSYIPMRNRQNTASKITAPNAATLQATVAKVEEEAKTDDPFKIASITDALVKSKNDSTPSPVKSSLKRGNSREGSGNRVRISKSGNKADETRSSLVQIPDNKNLNMGSDKMKPSVVDQIKGVKVDIPMSGSLQEQEEEA